MPEDMGLLMVTVSGKDRPGITAALSRILLLHQVEILDIEQASLQDLLGLTFLLDLRESNSSKDGVIKELLFEANRLHLTLHFRLFSESELKAVNKRKLFVLTYFGGTRALAEISRILGEESVNIETINSMNPHGAKCVEMMLNVKDSPNLGRLKQRLMAKSHELNTDLAFQKLESYRKNKRLIFFDMDCTLIDMEVIDELARRAGVFQEVSRITEKAMRGDFDFEESLKQRAAMLKGLKVEEMTRVRDEMRLSEGVREVTRTLKSLGFKLGVITGGFKFFAEHLKEKLGFDFAFANELEIKDGACTGRLLGPIIDAMEKARIVNQVSREQGIQLDQVVAVGDGANDALMLGQAGLGLSYNAKAGLDRAAQSSIGHSRFMNILYLLGVTEDDVRLALEEADKPA